MMDVLIEYYEAVYRSERKKKRQMASQSTSGETSLSSLTPEDKNPSLEVKTNDKSFKERFAKLFNSSSLSDVILRVGDESYYAHRFMLVVCSEVFEAMLNEERWYESKQQEIVLTELDECIPVFPYFLKYIYTGEVRLTTDNVLAILLLSDKYNISALCQTCVEYMLHHIVESPDTNRALSWYQYAKMTANDLLVTKCWKFILSNFDIVLKTTDWVNMTKAELEHFLSSNDLVASDEFYLWKNVETWVTYKYDESERGEVLKDVLPLLHFTMLPPKQLLQIENSDLYKQHKDVFMEKLNKAHRHHSLLSDSFYDEVSHERFRCYTSKIYDVSSKIVIEGYRSLEPPLSRYTRKMLVPIEFIASPDSYNCFKNRVGFEIHLNAKGAPKYSFYSSKAKYMTLAVEALALLKEEVTAQITVIIYGVKNGVDYVAFTYTNEHQFTTTTQVFRENNLVEISTISAENSPYLVKGTLTVCVFIKILKVNHKE